MQAITIIAFCPLLAACFAQNTRTNTLETDVTNNVKGDQSYGGVHLFEIHGEHGGIGMGWKVIFIVARVCLVAYWWAKRKTSKCFGLLPTILPPAPAPAAAPAPVAPPVAGYPLVVYQHPPAPVPAPRNNLDRDEED